MEGFGCILQLGEDAESGSSVQVYAFRLAFSQSLFGCYSMPVHLAFLQSRGLQSSPTPPYRSHHLTICTKHTAFHVVLF